MTHPTYRIAPRTMAFIEPFLRRRGEEGFEGVALFATTRPNDASPWLDIAIIPGQVAERSFLGVNVMVPMEEILDLASLLTSRDARLRLKIHTHPRRAYHSEPDDENMLMRFEGGVSLVVPNFARAPLWPPRGWSTNRFHTQHGEWERIANAEEVLQVEEPPSMLAIDHWDRYQE